jgi:predicted branched-subunit amino acid permease
MTVEYMFTLLELEATGWLAVAAILLDRNLKHFIAGLSFAEHHITRQQFICTINIFL